MTDGMHDDQVSPTVFATPNARPYRSPYGPSYKVPANFHGMTARTAASVGLTLGAFGAVAGIFAIYFLEGVPRVRKDILQRVPVLGDYWVREVPPSDNPF
ncbi:MAG: hypothetical protein M1838_000186 [Thelocarpon superellum]|nr:MAG: hypothetical protein M1838_000186 [Thelocarpon superellum]